MAVDSSGSEATICGANRQPFQANPLCGKCIDGYSEWNGDCIPCDSINGGLLFVVILVCALVCCF